MKIQKTVIRRWPEDAKQLTALTQINPDLVLVFGSVQLLCKTDLVQGLTKAFPLAQLVGCTTAGEISDTTVHDGSVVVTAVHFEKIRVKIATAYLQTMAQSRQAGEEIGAALMSPELAAIMVFAKGTDINGTALVDGITSKISDSVPVTGGLAGDDGAFQKTYTLSNAGLSSDRIVAAGFEGEALRFSHGCFGGWQPFGPMRRVTHCENNILYELDGEPALAIYKRYLGDYAQGLPASGLLFPFEMVTRDSNSSGLIRTILGVDETTGSLTLAGNIDPDCYLRLMHAQTDRLVDGAEKAAVAAASKGAPGVGQSLALLVSCVGRKLVMGERTEEEIETIAEVLGKQSALTGFYSYGEISPMLGQVGCKLHNQTMTITWLGEAL
jgi:hypothetical protein